MDTWVTANLLPIMTNASINMHAQISSYSAFMSFGYIPPNGNAGSYTLFFRAALSLGVEMTPSEGQHKIERMCSLQIRRHILSGRVKANPALR